MKKIDPSQLKSEETNKFLKYVFDDLDFSIIDNSKVVVAIVISLIVVALIIFMTIWQRG